jgi:predicted nucleotidyltransferase
MVDTRLDDPILTEMVTRLRAVFEPERIYLFGSHARGDAKPESDYDLLMVLPSSTLPRYRREQVAFRALAGMGISKEGLLKKAVSGVLANFPCSRTKQAYAPRVKMAAALLDGLF